MDKQEFFALIRTGKLNPGDTVTITQELTVTIDLADEDEEDDGVMSVVASAVDNDEKIIVIHEDVEYIMGFGGNERYHIDKAS